MMTDANNDLDRLLKAATGAPLPDDVDSEPPFGFDTRFVSLWRASANTGKPNGIASLLRGVAISSAAILLLATAGTFFEYKQGVEAGDVSSNEFAIADSAIQAEYSQ